MTNWEELKQKVKVNGFHIDKTGDGLGYPIEPHVKPLVLALNQRGYETSASCEGHPLSFWQERIQRLYGKNAELVFRARRGLVYRIKQEDGKVDERTINENPWVDIRISDVQKGRLEELLNYYNNRTGINWRM